MLFQKSWRDTRWRFLISLAIALGLAAALVFIYPRAEEFLLRAAETSPEGLRSRTIRDAMALPEDFRSYVWMQWGRQNLTLLLAIVLGAGSGLAHVRGGGALFTLALPVTRRRIMLARAATGLVELFVLCLTPTLLVSALAAVIGESFSPLDAIIFGFCVFAATSLFFSLTLALATVFTDVWRPMLTTFAAALVVGFSENMLGGALPIGVFRTLEAGTYFLTGELPWLGLLVCAAGAAGLIYAAVLSLERRDF